MSHREELLEATLDRIDEAVVIVDSHANVLFWNKSAIEVTGYEPTDVLAHPCPDLYPDQSVTIAPPTGKSSATILIHRSGYTVPGMLRVFDLNDSSGASSGRALLFHPMEELEAVVEEDPSGPNDLVRSHAEMTDRLEAAHHQWRANGIPFSILRITVDQAESLRTSHGRDACESMMRTMQQTLSRQIKPSEIIGRWDTSEFIALTHEHTPHLLVEHAQRLVGVARTADFRWWGDRVELTLSIGTAFVAEGYTLQSMLDAAREAMHTAVYVGGNHVTQARGL